MTKIKTQYQELIDFLESNKRKKVKTILPNILELVTAKSPQSTLAYDDTNTLVAIYCYYHKKWERVAKSDSPLIDEVTFGKKKHSTSGYNTMCKEGANHWSKQQRSAKKAKETLLNALVNNEISQEAMQQELDNIEANRVQIIPREDNLGFDTKEEIYQ